MYRILQGIFTSTDYSSTILPLLHWLTGHWADRARTARTEQSNRSLSSLRVFLRPPPSLSVLPYKPPTNPDGWGGAPRPLPGSSSPLPPSSPSARASSPSASTSPTPTSSSSARARSLATSSSATTSARSTTSSPLPGPGVLFPRPGRSLGTRKRWPWLQRAPAANP